MISPHHFHPTNEVRPSDSIVGSGEVLRGLTMKNCREGILVSLKVHRLAQKRKRWIMNHFDVLCLGVVVFLGGCCGLGGPAASYDWMNVPCKLLSSDFAHKYVREIDSLIEYQFVVDLASTYGDEECAEPLESIILLWCRGFRRAVELLWYWKDDRISRCLIMMLLLSDRENDRLDYFLKQSRRYERHECDQRREEIFFVAKRRDEYSRLVQDLRKKVDSLKYAPSATGP